MILYRLTPGSFSVIGDTFVTDQAITLSRKNLYDLVWSEPMTKLAGKFGLSDVGLKKKCRRLNIPVPPRGYWARKQAGQTPPVIPLPKGLLVDTVITIYRNPMHETSPPRPKAKRSRTRAIEKQISQSAQSTTSHPLIEQTRRILQSVAPNRDGIVKCPDTSCLDINVSPDALDRALSITNSVMKALETLGHEIAITEEGTSVVISGTQIGFSMTEELRKKHLEPQEHNLKGYYTFGYGLFSENRVPTGNLGLTIHPPSWTNARKNWRDTETQKLEDSLTSFIKGLLSIAARHCRTTASNDEQVGQ